VGLTANATAGLFVIEARTSAGLVREARFVDMTGIRASFPLGECPADAPETACAAEFAASAEAFRVSGERAAWLGGRALEPCTTALSDAAGVLAVPLGGGLRVESTARAVRVTAASKTRELWSAEDRADPEDASTTRAVAAFWARDPASAQPNLFVEMHRDPLGSPADVDFAVVPGAALGLAPCAARPTAPAAPALPDGRPARLDPTAAEADCLATTADGRHAAFLMTRSDRFDESEAGAMRAVRWFGPEPLPAVDLSCLAASCDRRAREALAKAIDAAGLVSCARVEGAVRIDGLSVPLFEGANALWLSLPGGPRWVRDVVVSAHDGGDHEAFEAVFQTGRTLPAFLSFHNADTGLSENRVMVLDEAAAGLCPR
jgi:hypothetical protein